MIEQKRGLPLSEEMVQVFKQSDDIREKWAHRDVTTAHMLFALTEYPSTRRIINCLGVNVGALRLDLVFRLAAQPRQQEGNHNLTQEAREVIREARRTMKGEVLTPEDLLSSLVTSRDGFAAQSLNRFFDQIRRGFDKQIEKIQIRKKFTFGLRLA